MADRPVRGWMMAAAFAVLAGHGGAGVAQDAPAAALPLELARQVTQRTIELVETKGLAPRQQAEYAQAKAALLALLDDQAAGIERQVLYRAINTLLGTLDVDGHSSILSPQRERQRQRSAAATGLRAPSFRLVTTANGTVLRWTPPQIVSSTMEARADYIKLFFDEAAGLAQLNEACAMVVDLSEQKGGNAWPPFIEMHPLFGKSNNAYMVDRDGKRIAFVEPSRLEALARPYAAGRDHPLARFAKLPLAVVVDGRTASAGEMLLVALLGEGDRVQTFGGTSRGLSTANMTYPLADGSTLVLTERRYAIGDQPVYRGGIAPAHPAGPDESADAVVKRAAAWAASQSPLCAARPAAT
jgi:hypothetical protein